MLCILVFGIGPVQLLLGMNKSRLVELMGHSTKKMVDEVYGKYRKGLVEERQAILDYMGEDFLALEELRITFPERYQQKTCLPAGNLHPEMAKTSALAVTFCQSVCQSQRLYADNYIRSQQF